MNYLFTLSIHDYYLLLLLSLLLLSSSLWLWLCFNLLFIFIHSVIHLFICLFPKHINTSIQKVCNKLRSNSKDFYIVQYNTIQYNTIQQETQTQTINAVLMKFLLKECSTVCTKLSSAAVFNIDNNNNYFLSSKSAYENYFWRIMWHLGLE